MKIYCALSPYDYNQAQTQVGATLKTLKGSPIKRSKFGVGKSIGDSIYVHKDYVKDVVPANIYEQAEAILNEAYPDFQYNCIKYTPTANRIAFQAVPEFDTAREPAVGDYIIVDVDDGTARKGHSDYIFHHKWLWVNNNYNGFDVADSWNWSKQWLSVLQEPSDGNGIERWNNQLNKYNLPIEGGLTMKKYKNINAAEGVEESISESTVFYPIELDYLIDLLNKRNKNPMLIWMLETMGFDALNLEQLYGSAVVDDVLYLCRTTGDEILIDGKMVDPETAIEEYDIDGIAPYIADPDDNYIARAISPDEAVQPDLEDAAIALLQQPYKMTLKEIVDAAKDFVDAYYFD